MYAQILLRDTPRIAEKGVGTKRRLSWCVARLSGVEPRRSLSSTPRRMAAEKRVSPAECRRRGVHGKLQQVQQEAFLSRILALQGREGRSEEHTSELQSPCNLVCR